MVALVRAWARECWPAWGVGGMLAILVLFFAGPWLVRQMVPASSYYDLRSVFVEDTDQGVPPRIVVDRSINREQFRGRREVEVMRAAGSQFIYWQCGGPHTSEWRTYRRGEALPETIDLEWWMSIPPNRPCPLPPGLYTIATTVYARGPLGAELSVTTMSNTFTVRGVE